MNLLDTFKSGKRVATQLQGHIVVRRACGTSFNIGEVARFPYYHCTSNKATHEGRFIDIFLLIQGIRENRYRIILMND